MYCQSLWIEYLDWNYENLDGCWLFRRSNIFRLGCFTNKFIPRDHELLFCGKFTQIPYHFFRTESINTKNCWDGDTNWRIVIRFAGHQTLGNKCQFPPISNCPTSHSFLLGHGHVMGIPIFDTNKKFQFLLIINDCVLKNIIDVC